MQLHVTSQSEVQRRPPDSFGKSGQGETLQACRSGSPHAPWKAGGRSETERSNLLHTLIKKRWRFPVPNQHISPPPLYAVPPFYDVGALGAVDLAPSWFAEEDALEVRIARTARHRRAVSALLRWLTYAAAAVTAAVLLFVVGYILVRGVPALSPDLFQWEYTSENVSLLPALASTVIMALLALALAVPVGVGEAVYLVEYARRGSRFVRLVRVTAETLQGIPSIIYGLFGMLFFVTACGWGLSLLSGACTLAIMVLPVIMRTTEEALLAVPDSYREGSFGLGAGKLRTVFTIVLPSAMPGILSGVILATGRIVGETAALIYTASTVAAVPASVFSSTRTLATHMYLLSNEGLHINETYGTAVVLLILVLLINSLSSFIAGRRSKK